MNYQKPQERKLTISSDNLLNLISSGRKIFSGEIIGSREILGRFLFPSNSKEEVIISDIDFSNSIFHFANISKITFNKCNFNNTEFKAKRLSIKQKIVRSDIISINFVNCNLSKANFSNADINYCLFNECNLDGIFLRDTRLYNSTINQSSFRLTNPEKTSIKNCIIKNSDLRESNFSDTKLMNIQFKNSYFEWSQISNSDFSNLNGMPIGYSPPKNIDEFINQIKLNNVLLPYSEINDAVLEELKLTEGFFYRSTFRKCTIENTDILKSNLTECSFIDTNINHVNFESSNLAGTKFINTIIKNSTNIAFDGSLLERCRIHKSTKEKWTQLKNNYTGSNFIFNMIFLLAFILPMLIKVVFWSNYQKILELTEQSEYLNFKEYYMWEIVLGKSSGNTLLLMTTISLLLYNLLRAFLTYKVGIASTEEQINGFTPEYHEYAWLYPLHIITKLLFYFSLIIFTFNLYHYIFLKISIIA